MTTEINSFDQFVPLAIRTESKFDTVQFNRSAFNQILTAGIAAGNLMDFVKKGVAYNKPIDITKFQQYVNDLHNAAGVLSNFGSIELQRKEDLQLSPRLFHGITGIVTEGAELLEAMEKAVQTGNWDDTNVSEEIFDCSWYFSILLDELGVDFYELLDKGIAKLKARYPEKYTDERAINRDLATERAILEA